MIDKDTIIHTPTQKDYRAVLKRLERMGHGKNFGEHWDSFEEETVIYARARMKSLSYCDRAYANKETDIYLKISAQSFLGRTKVAEGKSTNNIMQKLTSTLKRALSPALQAQYKAGLINGELELTTEGRNELLSILVVANEKEFTAVAKEIIVEAEK